MSSETSVERRRKMHKTMKSYRGTLSLFFIIGVIVSYRGFVVPVNTYIRCNDSNAAISFDLQEDTISITFLLVVSLFVPFVLMTIFEWIKNKPMYQNDVGGVHPLLKGLRRSYSYFLSLLVGSLFAFFLVEVLKTSVSEPRPHFMKSCAPNITQERCKESWIHVNYTDCRNPNELSFADLLDTMKSFPSGHACIGVFTTVFMIAYTQRRVKITWSKLLVAWFQLLWVVWALLCCVSRLWDKKHHWWDVVGGGIIGGLAGYGTVVYFCNWFQDERRKNEDYNHEIMPSNDQELTPTEERNGHYLRPPGNHSINATTEQFIS